MPLRDYQQRGLDEAVEVAATPGERRLWVAPTGSGKTHMMAEVLRALPGALLITPSMEIIRSMLQRAGHDVDTMKAGALWKAAAAERIWTPVRLRNRLRDGKLDPPTALLVDEAHHSTQAGIVANDLLDLLDPDTPWLGWTATPYRGSHDETEALREFWGEPAALLTIDEAAERGYMSVPEPAVWPLLNDAGIRIVAGEYDQEMAAKFCDEQEVIPELIERLQIERWYDAGSETKPAAWTRPTLIAVPTAEYRADVARKLTEAGLPTMEISGETPRAWRDELLDRCSYGEIALVQIQVLAEGVDMPWLRRLIDLRPLRSPVAWMQLVGRITRPVIEGEAEPEYVCGCRNAERHGYLFQGEWPARDLAAETQQAMGPPPETNSGGAMDRGVAKDALKSRKRTQVRLLDGGYAEVIHIGRLVGWVGTEALIIAIPGDETPRVLEREVGRGVWGKWSVSDFRDDGYTGWGKTTPSKALSAKQRAWWERAAARKGLDPKAPPTRQGFPILPALCDTGATLLASVATAPEPRPETQPAPPLDTEPNVGPWAATWTSVEGDWGARIPINGKAAPQEGEEVVLTSKDGRETVREIARVLAVRSYDGDRFVVATVRNATMIAAHGLGEGRYAIEDADDGGKLRFIVVRKDGALAEQAGPMLYDQPRDRAERLGKLVRDAGAEGCMARYGRELGRCGRCGRELTDETSRAIGIGPICREGGGGY
jgi:superfamily II DNA or RNA helicase